MYFAIFVVRVAASFSLCFSRKLRTWVVGSLVFVLVEKQLSRLFFDELWNGTSLVSVNRFFLRLDHSRKRAWPAIGSSHALRKVLVNEDHLDSVWGFNISAVITGTS